MWAAWSAVSAQRIAHLSSAGEWSRSHLDTSELWQHILDKWKILAYSRAEFHLFKCHTSAVSIQGFRVLSCLSDIMKCKFKVNLTAQMLNVNQIATYSNSDLKTFMMYYIICYLISFQICLYSWEISFLYLNHFLILFSNDKLRKLSPESQAGWLTRSCTARFTAKIKRTGQQHWEECVLYN